MELNNLDKVRALLNELDIIHDRVSMLEKINNKYASDVIFKEMQLLHERKVEILHELKEL